jgi:hypothetical protein
MKLLCLFGLILINIFGSSAQHVNELSNEVLVNFNKNNPRVSNIHWEKFDSNLVVFYIDKGNGVEKTYTINGKLIKIKLEMDPSFLPKSSTDYLAKFYGSSKLYKAFKIDDVYHKITYSIETDSIRLLFDFNGNFLKVEKLRN